MRRWHFLFLVLLAPARAIAGGPTAPNPPYSCSWLPSRIVLVGTDGTGADRQLGAFEVKVCRFTNPLNGATVVITGVAEPTNVRLGRESEPAQSQLANCSTPQVRATTDATGTCSFTLSGSVDVGAEIPALAPAVNVYANGLLLGTVPVVCYDLDGAGGVGANDLGLWLGLFGSGEAWLVADYNGDERLGADDLSLWLEVYGNGRQVESATPICP